MNDNNLILVGCGNMGFAMLQGWLNSGQLGLDDVTVIEPVDILRERAEALGVKTCSDVSQLPNDQQANIIVMAVKPQVMLEVLQNYRKFAPKACFVSVAPGLSAHAFGEVLGNETPIIRCMPNTPAAIGAGMMVIYKNDYVAEKTAETVKSLLSASGKVAEVKEEKLMDAVTAVSGSGPAYIFHFIECLTAAGVKAGLSEEIAQLLATQTVYGAGALAAQSADTPTRLREQVTSPNGTTAAALEVLMGEDRLKKLLDETVQAAFDRSVELGKD